MSFHIVRTKSCCFCCSNQTGTKIIGFTYVVFIILVLVLLASYTSVYGIGAVLLDKIASLQLVSSIFLLIGSFKENQYFLYPWIQTQFIIIIFSFMHGIVLILLRAASLDALYNMNYLKEIIIQLTSIAFEGGCLLVVYSYYRDLRDRMRINETSRNIEIE